MTPDDTPTLPAANLEWLFTEAGPSLADRVRRAAEHGFAEVEIWGWRNRDLVALSVALRETGLRLRTMIVEPALDLTRPSTHAEFLTAVAESVVVARRLGSPFLVLLAGDDVADLARAEQHANVVRALRAAVPLVPDDVTLLLEPLNDRVDHVGTFLTSTAEGLDVVAEVGSPRVRLLLDAYHALMMGEDLATVLTGRADLVGHVQIADVPGRGEPGSGSVDWPAQLRALAGAGYTGRLGLEFRPSGSSTEAVTRVQAVDSDTGPAAHPADA